jgi:hypothetical protein
LLVLLLSIFEDEPEQERDQPWSGIDCQPGFRIILPCLSGAN